MPAITRPRVSSFSRRRESNEPMPTQRNRESAMNRNTGRRIDQCRWEGENVARGLVPRRWRTPDHSANDPNIYQPARGDAMTKWPRMREANSLFTSARHSSRDLIGAIYPVMSEPGLQFSRRRECLIVCSLERSESGPPMRWIDGIGVQAHRFPALR